MGCIHKRAMENHTLTINKAEKQMVYFSSGFQTTDINVPMRPGLMSSVSHEFLVP